MKQADLLSGIKIVSKGIIAIFILLLVIVFPSGDEGMAASITLTIVHTNNVTGHLFACPS